MTAFAEPIRLTDKQEEQRAIVAAHRFSLAYGGSRSGKTFGFDRLIAVRAVKAPASRHLVYRKTLSAAKASHAGPNGTMTTVLERAFPDLRWKYHKQDGVFALENDSEIVLTGLDDHNIEKVLGTEYATIFGNELSETPFSSFELIRSRLAQTVRQVDGRPMVQRFFGDLNPTTRAHWTYRVWRDLVDPVAGTALAPDLYGWLQMNPVDNAANLDNAYLADLMSLGERARKRFWDGDYSADVEEALWRRAMIQRVQAAPKELRRIVVGVDPSISNEPGSDESGIVTAGIDAAQVGYVLADDSGKMRAEDWARRALAAYYQFEADAIVAEVNQGGDLVENQIRAMVRPGEQQPRIIKVHATRGKYVRAEPVAALYERRKVYHVGEFPELEDQMCSYTVDYDRKAQGMSPDRMDALVWAFAELTGDMTRQVKKARRPAPLPPSSPHGWMGV